MTIDNYYEILGISPNADINDIQSAIRTLRKKYRQVTGSPNKEQARNAEIMMEKLANAEKTLLDAELRAAYDLELRNQPQEVESTSSSGPTTDWVDSAKNYLAEGKPRNAAQAAKQATVIDSNNVEAWILRAYAGIETHDYADADFAASEAQRREPNNPDIHGLLGDIFDNEKRYAEARREFQIAADLEPENPYWQGRIIWSAVEIDGVKRAVEDARAFLTKFPDHEYAHLTYAFMLMQDIEVEISDDDGIISFSSPKQIAYAEKQLQIVKDLNCANETLIEQYVKLERLLKDSKRRRFIPQGFRYWIRLLVTIFIVLPVVTLIFDSGLIKFLCLLIAIGLIWFTVEQAYPKQWKINQRENANAR